MFDQLRRIVGDHRSLTFRECRQCGTAVDAAVSGCPCCGSSEIARYEF